LEAVWTEAQLFLLLFISAVPREKMGRMGERRRRMEETRLNLRLGETDRL